ncbi:MAG: glycosyltransferase [Thaumarchaeota archaeon]|nr:glycosyltransferase [Nitrososphaerota archaeon]
MPRIAVLYATYNDFMSDHAEYDINEARKGGIPFYILDDSTDLFKKAEVEQFSRKFACQVLRRRDRTGYKAGAMNNWAKQYGDLYDYFFILDSDSQASLGSIQRCVELVRRDREIGVVQTKTLTMTSNPTRLTRSSVCVQHAYMEIVQKAMRNLGTSPYYGHNALISIEALRKVGGFVEESNEDYKTLARIHTMGYRSIYAESAITWEEVPPDYLSARKRSLRWSRDAVSQLGLLKFGNPLAIMFFLFYGWVTHISNLALLLLLPILTAIEFPHLFGNISTELAGFVALTVIFLWPLLALRVNDSELTTRKLAKSLLWGSVFNIPMMAPIGLQIVKTSVMKVCTGFCGLIGIRRELEQEFVVTPKIRNLNRAPSSIVRHLKAEISLAVVLVVLALITNHDWSLIFAAPQILSALSIPLLVYFESGNRVSQKHPMERPPMPMIRTGQNAQRSVVYMQEIYLVPQMYRVRRIC